MLCLGKRMKEMKEREINFILQTLAKVCSVYVCIMKAVLLFQCLISIHNLSLRVI